MPCGYFLGRSSQNAQNANFASPALEGPTREKRLPGIYAAPCATAIVPTVYTREWVEGEPTILLGKVWRMRKSETMRAASRLLLSHPIVCARSVGGGSVGVLGPLR